MTPNDPILIRELRRDEGVRRSPYKDTVDVNSVGVGHNLHTSPLPEGWTYPLSDAQIDELLLTDLTHVFSGLDAHAGWWRTLTYARQRVIANMAFNMGVAGVLEFKHMIGYITSSDFTGAAKAMLASKWAAQVGERADRLAEMMEIG